MNTELMILNKPIRQFDGLYCLNDLHKASGGESRHQVSNWLKLNQTVELIDEIPKHGIPCLEQNQQVIKTIRGGNQAGTYACRELVLAYATWISPKFFLLVLRTFDAVAFGQVSGSMAPKIKPRGDYPPPKPFSGCLKMLPPPPQNLAEARALFAQIDHAERMADINYHEALAAQQEVSFIIKETRSWRDYWVRVEACQAID